MAARKQRLDLGALELRFRELLDGGSPEATDAALAEVLLGLTNAKQLRDVLSLEPLGWATFTHEDGHGEATSEAVLMLAQRWSKKNRLEALALLSTLACPDFSGWLIQTEEPHKVPARKVLRGALPQLVALASADPSARDTVWMTLSRAPASEEGRVVMRHALVAELDPTVRAALHLALASFAEPSEVEESDAEAEGLLGWAASFRAAWRRGAATGPRAARLLTHLSKPLRLPPSWAFVAEDPLGKESPATTADLTSELLTHVEVDAADYARILSGLRGPEAPRRIATLAFGLLVERPGQRHLVFPRLPRAGLRIDRLSPLSRQAIAALLAHPWDHPLGWALGVAVADAPHFVGDDRSSVEHAALVPPLAGYEGASLAWIWRSCVLGDRVHGPSVEALRLHLADFPVEPLLSQILMRMPRALLSAQVLAQEDPAAAWARDAALLDVVGRDPRFHAPIAEHLRGYRTLGADDPRALGRLLEASGQAHLEGASARVADAQKIYGPFSG